MKRASTSRAEKKAHKKRANKKQKNYGSAKNRSPKSMGMAFGFHGWGDAQAGANYHTQTVVRRTNRLKFSRVAKMKRRRRAANS